MIALWIAVFLSGIFWAGTLKYGSSDENREKARKLLPFPFVERWFEPAKEEKVCLQQQNTIQEDENLKTGNRERVRSGYGRTKTANCLPTP
jgi:hypothetical protein